MLITETFGSWALAEGAAPELKRCIESNLKADGKCLPERVSLHLGAFDQTPEELVGPFLNRSDGLQLNLAAPLGNPSLTEFSLLDNPVLHSEQCLITLGLTENAGDTTLCLARRAKDWRFGSRCTLIGNSHCQLVPTTPHSLETDAHRCRDTCRGASHPLWTKSR